MKPSLVVWAAVFALPAFAALPPAPEAAKDQAKEAAAKSAWSDKVAAYQLCLSMDRTVDSYRKARKAAGEAVPQPTQTPPCTDPGPYVPTIAQKPLEASGAHSPADTAVAPPSSNATAAQLQGSSKKQ
jgi:hypothetical protein